MSADFTPTFTVVNRHMPLRSDEVQSIQVQVTYPHRTADVHIVPARPLDGSTPQDQAILQEFERLRDALNHILDARKP